MHKNKMTKKQKKHSVEEEDNDDQISNNLDFQERKKNKNENNKFNSSDNNREEDNSYYDQNYNSSDSYLSDSEYDQEILMTRYPIPINHKKSKQKDTIFEFFEKSLKFKNISDLDNSGSKDDNAKNKQEDEPKTDKKVKIVQINDKPITSDINNDENLFNSDDNKIVVKKKLQLNLTDFSSEYSEEESDQENNYQYKDNKEEEEEEEEEQSEKPKPHENQEENEDEESQDEDISIYQYDKNDGKDSEDHKDDDDDDDEEKSDDDHEEDSNEYTKDDESEDEEQEDNDDKVILLNEIVILNTINFIGSEKFYFDDIIEAIEIKNILRILKELFEDKCDLENIKCIKNFKGGSDIEKFVQLFKFLETKKTIFKVIKFDFNDPETKKASAISFYTKILDSFFLKQTKQEMLDRCETLLFTKVDKNDSLYEMSQKINKNPKQKHKILLNWDTYLALLYFLNEGKIHFNKEKVTKEAYSFQSNQIPKIIDENCLKQFKTDSSPLYYQLQFIYNALDEQDFCHHLIETYLISIRKFNCVKVPKYSTIVKLMIPKNIALTEKSMNKDAETDDDVDDKDDKIDPLKRKFSVPGKIPQTFVGFEIEYGPQIGFDSPPQIEKYKNRIKSNSLSLIKSRRLGKLGRFQSSEEFWNPIFDNFSYENGIFKITSHEKIEYFDTAIKNYKKEFIDLSDRSVSEIENFIKEEPKNTKFKLYKFFIYDEKTMKWMQDKSSINSFISKMGINANKFDNPLVYYSNSYEKDVIKLNSNLIGNLLPDVNNEEQIFVYALYGKALKSFKEMKKKKKKIIVETRNPIYLLLHVPENKRKLKNIDSIILKLDYFLSFICDIKIVILDQHYYRDQISLLAKFNNIRISYNRMFNLKSLQFYQSLKLYISSINKKKEEKKNKKTDDADFSSDGDEDQYEIKKDKDDDDDEIPDDVFSDMKMDDLTKEPNIIVLTNSGKIKSEGYFRKIDQTNFFNNMREYTKYKNFSVNFINVKDKSTYRDFLSSLNQFAFDCEYFDDNITKRFDYYQMSHVCSFYIHMRFKEEMKSNLNEMIINRFKNFEDNNYTDKSKLYLLSQLNKELIKSYPSIDINYSEECNNIINSLKDTFTNRSKRRIEKELRKSSNSSIQFWKDKINKIDFLSNEIKDNIQLNHEEFLKNEFFDIITELYPKKERSFIFKGNEPILIRQINADKFKLKQEFDLKQTVDLNQKTENISDLKDKGTNYMIREKENVREMKIIVEPGGLDKEIENDF